MYIISEYTKHKAKQMGLEVRHSTNPHKKLDVFRQGKKIASIGAVGYSDYPHYIQSNGKAYAEERRRLYHLRHTQDSIGEKLALHLLW